MSRSLRLLLSTLLVAACSFQRARTQVPEGTSCVTAVTIEGFDKDIEQLEASRQWIAKRYPGSTETNRNLALCGDETLNFAEVQTAGGKTLILYFRYVSPPSKPNPTLLVLVALRDGKIPTLEFQRRVLESEMFKTGMFAPPTVIMRQFQFADAVYVWAYEFEVRGEDRARIAGLLVNAMKIQPETCMTFIGREWRDIAASELALCAAGTTPPNSAQQPTLRRNVFLRALGVEGS